MRDTLYSHTWPPFPLPGRRRSRLCTERCISCVCYGGGCSRCPVPLPPPGSCPGTLGGRPSPGFGTPRSLAVSGRHLGPVPLGRPPLQAEEWRTDGLLSNSDESRLTFLPALFFVCLIWIWMKQSNMELFSLFFHVLASWGNTLLYALNTFSQMTPEYRTE